MGLFISFSALAEDALDAELSIALSRLLPDVEIDDVSPTPIDGLYQVVIGSDIIYMTRDGIYVIKGDITGSSRTSKSNRRCSSGFPE